MKKSDLIVNFSLLFFSSAALLVTAFIFNGRKAPSLNIGLSDDKAVIAAKVVNVEEGTASLRKAVQTGQVSGTGGSAAIQAIALARKKEFLDLMNKSPEQAVKLALSPTERSQLPPEVQASIEQNKAVSGKLDVNIIQDPVDHVPKRTVVIVTKEGKRYTLHMSNNGAGRLYTGGKLAATGMMVDDQIAVTGSSLDQAKEVAFPSPRRRATSQVSGGKIAEAGTAGEVLGSQSGPNQYQTSEYMFGKVAVGVVMPQCNGIVDKCTELWTSSRMDLVYNQVQAAMSWWTARMGGRVSFVFDQRRQVPTGYEPINHPQSDESLWIGDVMGHMGYSSGNSFDRVYAYNNWMRQNYNTDWAVTIFVVDSNNGSGTFTSGHFAYSYVQGPYSVLTYDNDGYGINNLAAVAAHETGHTFGALDEYTGAGVPCTETSGYLVVQNQNSQQAGCASNVGSIMRGGVDPYTSNLIDQYAAGMLGLRISSGNSIPDPINSKPKVTLDPAPSPMTASPTLTGTADDQPYVPPSGSPVMIGYVSNVQYRVNGGSWQNASLVGSGNNVTQKFSFSPSFGTTPTGNQLIDVQATDRFGATSDIASMTVVFQPTVTPTPTPTPTPTVSPSPSPSLTPTLTPTPTTTPTPTPGGVCTTAPPVVTVAQQSQQGHPGDSIVYNLTLTNTDSSGCAASQLSMTPLFLPTGWTQTPPATVQTLTPGQSFNLAVTISSPNSAAVGSYGIWDKVTNSSTGLAAYALLLYQVTSGTIPTPTPTPTPTPCVRAVPKGVFTPATQTGKAGSSLSYSLTLTNNDSLGCPSSQFFTVAGLQAGWSQTPASDLRVLSPGQSANISVTVTSSTGTQPGSWQVPELITNQATNLASYATGFYVIPTPTPAPTPTPPPPPPPGNGCVVNENFTSMPMWSSSWDATWGRPASWSANGYLGASRSDVGSSVRAKIYQISPNTVYTVSLGMNGRQGQYYWTEAGYKLGSYSAQNFDDGGSTWTLINKFDGYGTYPNGNGGAWSTYSSSVNSGGNNTISIGFKAGLGQGNSYPGGNWSSLKICSATTPTPTPTPLPTPTPTPTSVVTPTPTPAAGQNIAPQSSATASSIYSPNYSASKAIDGIKGQFDVGEWASLHELLGAWLQLNWGSSVNINKVVLYDRPNLYDWVQSGTLLFSDGSSVGFGQLQNDGITPLVINFSSRTVTWVKIQVNAAAGGYNIGLSEIEVYGTMGVAAPTPTPVPTSTLPPTPTPTPIVPPSGCTASCVSAVTTGTCLQGTPCKTSDQRTNPLPKVTFTVNSSGCSSGVVVDLSLGQFSPTAAAGDVPAGTWWSAAQINQPGTASADWNFCNNSVCHTFDPGQTLYWRVRDAATGQSKAICSSFSGPPFGQAMPLPGRGPVLGASTQINSLFGEVIQMLKDLMIGR